jgi:membrane-bound lytic murein transglycosylase D
MFKKIILLISFSMCSIALFADEMSTTFMLMNNYNARQMGDIWSRMRAGFKMSHTETSRVKYYERFYTKNPKALAKKFIEAKPYLYYILNEVERFGAPSEIALLAAVESFYNPHARSKSNAYGMWQFLPGTGQRFNLVQNSDIDERQDIVKSTDAALTYLMYMYSLFGQWELAIGAYNSGEGAMYKVVRNSGQKRGEVTYDDLSLREETQNYVPKLIALANIIENPKRFGVTLDELPNEPYFAITSPVVDTDLGTLAKLSKVDNKTFAKLNPQYKSDNYKLSKKHKVLLPVTNQNVYYASIDPKNTVANTNEIQLASQSNLSPTPDVSDIKQVNFETRAETLAAADDIDNIINQQPDDISGSILNASSSTSPGSTTNTTSSLTVTTPTKLSSVSPAKSTTIAAATPNAMYKTDENRQMLDDLIDNLGTDGVPKKSGIIAASEMVDIASKDTAVKYTVGQGDTLYSIARRFNVKVDDIRIDNKIPGDNLSSGQVLKIRQTGELTSPKTSS